VRSLAPSAAIAAAAAVVLVALMTRIGDWAVMTDELLYERLAISIAQPGLPRVHGEIVDVYALLYPLLLAPVFALVSLPQAVVVAHALNGILFASAAIPTHLLGRELGLAPLARGCAAIFSVALPWTVIGGFLMTEAAAYPAFLWAALAIQRAAVLPSDRRYAVALIAIAVAALARPQLIVLAVALVIAAAIVEWRERRGVRAHRLLLATAGLAVLVIAAMAATGTLGSALGSYAPTIEEGSLLSLAVLRSAAAHLDVLAVSIAIVPLLLGGGWAVEALVRRPPRPELQAFAALLVTTVTLLALQVGSFAERFGGGEVKDRYFFYVAPLLFLATAAALADPTPRLIGLMSVTALFVLTVGFEDFTPFPGIHVDTPASAAYDPLRRVADDLASWLAIAAGVVAVALFFALRRAPRVPTAVAVLAGVSLVATVESGYAWDRLLGSNGPSGRALTTAPPDDHAWIDRALPGDAEVGMIPYSLGDQWFASAILWWDVEFWNKRVARGYLFRGRFGYTPETFPPDTLAVDFATGAVSGEVTPYVVRSNLDARFGLAGQVVATRDVVEVVQVELPARLAWATRGLDPDGWTRPNRPATLRVYGEGVVAVSMSLGVPSIGAPRGYDLGGPRVGYLARGETRELQFEVCAQGGHADLPIRVLGAGPTLGIAVPPPTPQPRRIVGARVSKVSATPTGRTCRN
jgi:hypothetical protein